MMLRSRWILLATAVLATSAAPAAGAPSDIARIVDEGMNRSEAMLNASELMDRIGPRLTNSHNLDRAEDWALAKFRAYGLSNVHREPFSFGRGWNFTSSSARMIEPRLKDMTEIPVAWTPGTNGIIRAPIIVAPISKVEHFAAWRGKLAGKIVLVSLPGTSDEPKEGAFKRLTDSEIAERDNYNLPNYDPESLDRRMKRFQFATQLDDFLKSEGALAWVRISYRDNNLITGEGYTYLPGHSPSLPGFELAAEDYRRLARLAKTGPAPVIDHAGVPITSSNVDVCSGCCTAYMIFASTGSTSGAKCARKSSSGSQAKPSESTSTFATAGVGGPCASSAPIDSPSSRPNAAM